MKKSGYCLLKNYGLIILCFLPAMIWAQKESSPPVADRKQWLWYMDRVARPVLYNLAEGRLKEHMPVLLSEHVDNKGSRMQAAYLEAFARTLSGLAPWLNLEGGDRMETELREQYRGWALRAIAHATDPQAKDFLQWQGGQPLVDASYLAFALIRCPWLWHHLDSVVKQQVVSVLKSTRATVPVYSNWILFSGMIEAFFCQYNLDYDPVRIEYAVREFADHWYTGDGLFSDGMQFHMDYYNSFVIQPNLAAIVSIANQKNHSYAWFIPRLDTINRRYAVLLERMVNRDGTYPVFGRSICYRGGVFHHLADMALRNKLPTVLHPAQVRCALTAVLQKTLGPASFTADGWLTIGLNGNQPGLADVYITTGSLYFCANLFVPLGLPDIDPFWSAPAEPWTAVKVWNGQDVPADHALDLK
jgi:hypothetical protein